MLPTPSNKPFKFSSPHGWQICHEIITDNLATIWTHEGITCHDASFPRKSGYWKFPQVPPAPPVHPKKINYKFIQIILTTSNIRYY